MAEPTEETSLIRPKGAEITVHSIDWTRLLQRPAEELSDVEVEIAYGFLDAISKAGKARMTEMKARLREMIEQRGHQQAAKTLALETDSGGEYRLTRSSGSKRIDEPALHAVLQERGMPLSAVFDTVQVPAHERLTLNQERLEALIQSGRLSQDEVDRFTTIRIPTPRLSVRQAPFGLSRDTILGRSTE